MRLACKEDQTLVVDILSRAFKANPSANWVVKQDADIDQRIKTLCAYSFKTAFLRNGVFISDNEKGVALCYRYNSRKEGLKDYWNQLILTFNAIGVSRILKILKRESYTKSKRPASGDFLYFWFFGVDPDFQDGNAARDLKEYIFNLSEKENLPIYLETSVEKNKRVYLKFGFEIYHTWKLEEQGLELYFMRKEPFK